MPLTQIWARAVLLAVVLIPLAPMRGAAAAEAGDYAPANIERTVDRLKYLCLIAALCPVKQDVRDVIKQAIAKDRSAEYLLGLTLLTGDGLPRDASAGVAWIVLAAEAGEPAAARDIARRLRNGESVQVDETKIAEALKPQVDAGDVEAMRALGPMLIGGRGTKPDPPAGVALLRRAAQLGSTDAEVDLSQLYLNGAPGVPIDRPEAMRWLAASARHGNVEAMLNLGYMSLMSPSRAERDVARGFCWLTRSALLDQVQAQEKLSMVFAQGEKDDGAGIAIDLVRADLWFRLAARNPYHDNSQIRAMIEPHMTTDQLNEAKRQFETWHALTLPEVRALTIPLPAATANGASPGNCPPMS